MTALRLCPGCGWESEHCVCDLGQPSRESSANGRPSGEAWLADHVDVPPPDATPADPPLPPLQARELSESSEERVGGEGLSSPRSLSSQPVRGEPEPWPALDPAALHGLAGKVVETIAPHTEADPVALLLVLLAAFGNAVHLGPRAFVGATVHTARIWPLLVGETARARKGTAQSEVDRIMKAASSDWAASCRITGIGSGEGLVVAIADGEDGRAFVVEEEFDRILAVCAREGSTLSALLRQAFDREIIEIRTRKNSVRAENAHVTVVAHITLGELRTKLDQTSQANGFANRFLFACVERKKLLPHGGSLSSEQVGDLGAKVGGALEKARGPLHLKRTPKADRRWEEIYEAIAENEPGGLVGAVTARADALTLRLSMAYALLDASRAIDVPHLEAAWAVWRYCEQSARFIFGDSLGDPVADALLRALRAAGAEGLDGTAQHTLFGRHTSAARLDRARGLLEQRGLAKTVQEQTGGRPRVITYAVQSEPGDRK